LIFICVAFLVSCNQKNEDIAAYVNGKPIFHEKIITIVAHFDHPEVTYESILNNTIDEYVVLCFGESLGIVVSDDEFDEYIRNYVNHFSFYYDIGVDVYGEESYLEGLRVGKNFSIAKEYIIKNIIETDDITLYDLNSFLDNYFNGKYKWNDLTEAEKESAYDIILEVRKEIAFNNWVTQEREKYDIIIS